MNRFLVLGLALAASMPFTLGCASKKYTRQQTAPIINKVNELDELTARNTNDIRNVDARAQSGIQGVNEKAAAADQKAVAAGQAADQAGQLAQTAHNRVESLANTVVNLDNYRPVTEVSVHFGFDRDNLTRKAREALDQLGTDMQSASHYIVVVDGNTDSTGPAEYNYQLSKRRANSVIQYLASKYQLPAHKIYVIGLGEDKPVSENATTEGRRENRRVDIRLMTNTAGQEPPSTSAAANPGQ